MLCTKSEVFSNPIYGRASVEYFIKELYKLHYMLNIVGSRSLKYWKLVYYLLRTLYQVRVDA